MLSLPGTNITALQDRTGIHVPPPCRLLFSCESNPPVGARRQTLHTDRRAFRFAVYTAFFNAFFQNLLLWYLGA